MMKPKKNESKQDFLSRCTKELIDQGDNTAEEAYKLCNVDWDSETRNQRAALTLSAPLELEAGDGDSEDPSSFMITAYTGAPVETWFGRIIFDVKGMKTKAKFPVLREHERDRIVGFGTKTWKDDSHLFLKGDFARDTKDGEEIKKLAIQGFPWQASIGIWPEKIKVLDSEKESAKVNGQEIKGPMEIWTQSRVGEVSFVALGADDDTAAIVLADNGNRVPVIIEGGNIDVNTLIVNKEIIMDLKELNSQYPELYLELFNLGAASVDMDAARAAALTEGAGAERQRIQDVEAQALPGHEDLIAQLKFDGKTSGPEAAVQVLQAERALGAKTVAALDDDAVEPVKHAAAPEVEGKVVENKDLPVDERAKASWDNDPAIRTEFQSDYDSYLAYYKAKDNGQVKILGKN